MGMRYAFPMVLPVAFDRIYTKLTEWYYRLRSIFLVWTWGVRHGRSIMFQGKTIIRTRKFGEITVGNNVIFNSQRNTNLVGLMGPTILDTLGGGRIEIGDHSGFSSVVMSSRTSIKVGSRVKVGGNVRIFDHDFHSLEADYRRTLEDRQHIRSKAVFIEDDCFIGTNAIILKGTHLGARTIVAAGSVVFGLDVPEDSMVKGNPAKVFAKKDCHKDV